MQTTRLLDIGRMKTQPLMLKEPHITVFFVTLLSVESRQSDGRPR